MFGPRECVHQRYVLAIDLSIILVRAECVRQWSYVVAILLCIFSPDITCMNRDITCMNQNITFKNRNINF